MHALPAIHYDCSNCPAHIDPERYDDHVCDGRHAPGCDHIEGGRLAIVGSVSLAGNADAYAIIFQVIRDYAPSEIVSGGADGIDSMAVEVAAFLGIPFREYRPKNARWAPEGYKERNLLVAGGCERLVRIVAAGSRTYGSGWTRDRAAERGIPTHEFIV